MGIPATAAFAVQSMYHCNLRTIPGQLFFGRQMTLPINHLANCRFILQRKQGKIEKDILCKNSTRIDHNYRVGNHTMVRKQNDLKYETPFKGLYDIVQTWTNRNVAIQTGADIDNSQTFYIIIFLKYNGFAAL